MRVHFIRHGMTIANENKLYCGATDLTLSEKGRADLLQLKNQLVYPLADCYITSGLLRTTETLNILYGKSPDDIMQEFQEFHFGDFEMKSHEALKDTSAYQEWLDAFDKKPCPGGESKPGFEQRVRNGLLKLRSVNVPSAVVVCHGGVIATIMEQLLPGQKNFYEWQPTYGRGYTVEITSDGADFLASI